MEQQVDAKIGRLLRADAPAERDVLFRIGLIERRERVRYRRRQQALLAAALVFAALIASLLLLRPTLFSPELLRSGLLALFVIALIAAAARGVHGLQQALRWLRGVQNQRR
jgi:hypothetical protein